MGLRVWVSGEEARTGNCQPAWQAELAGTRQDGSGDSWELAMEKPRVQCLHVCAGLPVLALTATSSCAGVGDFADAVLLLYVVC